jgi:transcriptional regulator with XRE-family HTH domain
MARNQKSRQQWISERMEQMPLTQTQLLRQTGLARQTFKRIERGEGTHPRSIRNVEAALSWAEGSMAEIDAGREPTVVDVDAVLSRPLPAPRARPETDDLSAMLRVIRQRMGPAAFWREVGIMEGEESAEQARSRVIG